MTICPGAVADPALAVAAPDFFLAFLPFDAVTGTHGPASESFVASGNGASTVSGGAGSDCAGCDGGAGDLETCLVEAGGGWPGSPSLFKPLIRRYKAKATIKIRADATATE